MKMKTFLVTGFEPFGGEPVNAAWEVVSHLQGLYIADAVVVVRQLPTVFKDSVQALNTAIEETQPDVVLCVGQAGGRSAVSVERIGVNLDDASIADNAGQQPNQEVIVAGGPEGYFSTLPVRKIVAAIRAAGIPAEESWSAGTYVCNHVLYGLQNILHRPEWQQRGTKGGFIHIPYLPEQSARNRNAPCLPKELVANALVQAISVICTAECDSAS